MNIRIYAKSAQCSTWKKGKEGSNLRGASKRMCGQWSPGKDKKRMGTLPPYRILTLARLSVPCLQDSERSVA